MQKILPSLSNLPSHLPSSFCLTTISITIIPFFFYSHSWHWNQSRSFQFPASSWLIRSSSPHPQQDTNSVLLSFRTISLFISLFILFISLLFLSLTGNSIAQSQKIASFIFTFFHFFFYVLKLLIINNLRGAGHPYTPSPPKDPPIYEKKF